MHQSGSVAVVTNPTEFSRCSSEIFDVFCSSCASCLAIIAHRCTYDGRVWLQARLCLATCGQWDTGWTCLDSTVLIMKQHLPLRWLRVSSLVELGGWNMRSFSPKLMWPPQTKALLRSLGNLNCKRKAFGCGCTNTVVSLRLVTVLFF